ncbi:hypothetical protein IJ00_07240 [Calothrix sp. 336/3]|nr:hypothetical protein IJ00_07240 [Calothrix sp. 336/3]
MVRILRWQIACLATLPLIPYSLQSSIAETKLLAAAVPTNNLQVSTATYLGGAGEDRVTATDVAPDKTVVLGGTWKGFNPGNLTPINLLAGGDGAVIRLNTSGSQVISVTRLGSTINDLEVSNDGKIAVCGDFGVAVLNPQANQIIWQKQPVAGRAVSRCSIGNDGAVAALSEGFVYTYDNTGKAIANWKVGGNQQNDVAIDGASGSVFTTGFKQDDGYKCSQLQIAFLNSYNYSGQLKWQRFNWNKTQAGDLSLCADTRGQRISMGRDGKLYFAGESSGGNTIYQRDPGNITQQLGGDRLISTDAYNTPYNTSSNWIIWYGRFTPSTGTLERSQFLLARLPAEKGNKGNTIRARAITADEKGQVYLSGTSACCIANRDAQRINGQPVGAYTGDTYILVTSADFKQRLVWTPFPGTTPGSIAVRQGVAVVGMSQNANQTQPLVTVNPLQSKPVTLPDAYFAIWLQP